MKIILKLFTIVSMKEQINMHTFCNYKIKKHKQYEQIRQNEKDKQYKKDKQYEQIRQNEKDKQYKKDKQYEQIRKNEKDKQYKKDKQYEQIRKNEKDKQYKKDKQYEQIRQNEQNEKNIPNEEYTPYYKFNINCQLGNYYYNNPIRYTTFSMSLARAFILQFPSSQTDYMNYLDDNRFYTYNDNEEDEYEEYEACEEYEEYKEQEHYDDHIYLYDKQNDISSFS
ncbi:Plasmodium exported protein, unknown function [Plasmodium sp.]|nr:Plasmodium exported protein, unknown function [Plasmodium sp.]